MPISDPSWVAKATIVVKAITAQVMATYFSAHSHYEGTNQHAHKKTLTTDCWLGTRRLAIGRMQEYTNRANNNTHPHSATNYSGYCFR